MIHIGILLIYSCLFCRDLLFRIFSALNIHFIFFIKDLWQCILFGTSIFNLFLAI